MLERVARCLDSGARPSAWRPARLPTPSRRTLHSDFWRHGAGDLDLPTWCFATMSFLFETTPSPRADSFTFHSAWPTPDAPFLDFLYPASARELLQRDSLHASPSSAHKNGARPRRYTSRTRTGSRPTASSPPRRRGSSLATARLDQRDDALLAAIRVYTDHAANPPAPARHNTVEPVATPTSATPISTDDWSRMELLRRNMDSFKRNHDRTTASHAFDAYQALPATLRSVQLAKDLVSIMSEAPAAADAQRISKLLQDIPLPDRDVNIYSNAIAAYVQADALGQAVLIHDEALQRLETIPNFTATNHLIYRLLGSKNWQSMLHLYTTRRNYHLQNGDEQGFRQWSLGLERELCQGHNKDYPIKLFKFLECLARHPYIADEQGVRSCVRLMVHAVFGHALTFGKYRTAVVLKTLRGLGVSSAYVYEGAIRSVHQMVTPEKDRLALSMQYYKEYQLDYQDLKPTKVLLRRLLNAAVKINDESAVKIVVDDWESHYGKLSNDATGLLIAWRTRRGEVSKAETLFSELVGQPGGTVTWKRLMPLLHGDAMLGRPQAVEKRIADAESQHHLSASIVAYNVLLLAYLRQDDYVGLMSTFTRIIEADLEPDAYTFGTVMALTADRGDAELTDQFRRMASSYNIQSQVLDEELILAHINNDNVSKAEELANEFTASNPTTGTTRMWTQILLGYASRRDFRAAIYTSQRMTQLGVQFDQISYAALMKVFIEDKKPLLAQDLMQRMTVKDKLQPLAIHYAMLIQAYVQEARFETALRAYAKMLEQGITASMSVRVALLELHARAAQQKFKVDTKMHPGVRFDIAEELLEEILNEDEAKYITTKEPQLVKQAGHLDRSHYFQILLDVYGRQKAHGAVEMLLRRYAMQQSQAGKGDEIKPLRMILHVMRLRYAQRDYDDVERYWQLAKKKAVDSTSTVRATKPRLPLSKRNLLSRHLDVYMRALQAGKRQDQCLGIFQEIVGLGFDLDYLNWNRYISMLLTRNRVVEGFVLCERNLMDSFPGWNRAERRSKYLVASGRKGAGLEYMGKRMSFVEPGTLTVTHSTMVHMRKTIRDLQSAALYRSSAQQMLDELQRRAPRTVEAALRTPGARRERKRQ